MGSHLSCQVNGHVLEIFLDHLAAQSGVSFQRRLSGGLRQDLTAEEEWEDPHMIVSVSLKQHWYSLDSQAWIPLEGTILSFH